MNIETCKDNKWDEIDAIVPLPTITYQALEKSSRSTGHTVVECDSNTPLGQRRRIIISITFYVVKILCFLLSSGIGFYMISCG